jgi:tRNA G18 (ribose-2'-O)-methylase SpoU
MQSAVKGLRVEGWNVFAMEEDARAIDIVHAPRANNTARPEVLILGNEVTGVDPELLELCDEIFCIPMRGAKKSFNVAIAFGIAAYALTAPQVES